MLHGSCGTANPMSPCMKDSACTPNLPTPFAASTTIDEDGCVLYARPNNGSVFVGVPLISWVSVSGLCDSNWMVGRLGKECLQIFITNGIDLVLEERMRFPHWSVGLNSLYESLLVHAYFPLASQWRSWLTSEWSELWIREADRPKKRLFGCSLFFWECVRKRSNSASWY